MHFTQKKQTRRNLNNIYQKNTKKSPIHENTNAKITCDFGDERCRIAAARLEKDIFVRTHLHTSPLVVNMALCEACQRHSAMIWSYTNILRGRPELSSFSRAPTGREGGVKGHSTFFKNVVCGALLF